MRHPAAGEIKKAIIGSPKNKPFEGEKKGTVVLVGTWGYWSKECNETLRTCRKGMVSRKAERTEVDGSDGRKGG